MKPLKWILSLLAALVGLLIIQILYVILVLDPNDYKQPAMDLIQEKTGFTPEIENLDWSFFPWIGLEVSNATLKDANQALLAQIGKAHIKVKLMPLLHKSVEVSEIQLIKPQIYVTKKTDGHINWELPTDASKPPAPADQPVQTLPVTIDQLNIKDGALVYRDQVTNQRWDLNDLNVSLNDFELGENSPFILSFNLSGTEPLNLELKAQGDVNLDLMREVYQIQVSDSKIDIQSVTQLTVKADVTSTPSSAEINLQRLAFDDSEITGQVFIKDFTTQRIEADLTLDQINLDRYLTSETQETTSPQEEQQQQQQQKEAPLFPTETLKTLNAKASVHIHQLLYQGLPTQNVELLASAQNGLLRLEKLTAKTLEGTVQAAGTLDVRKPRPALSMHKELSQIQLNPLITTFLNQDLLSGSINLKTDITTQGDTVSELIDGLNGVLHFEMPEGALKGVNLTELAYQELTALSPLVEALLPEGSKQKLPPAFQKNTQISDLMADIRIENGSLHTNNFKADLSKDTATVSGTADFNLTSLDGGFDLNLQLDERISNPYVAKLIWPIHCDIAKASAFACKVNSTAVKRELENMLKEKAKTSAKAAAAKKEAEIRQKLKTEEDAAKQKLEEKEDALKEKLQDKLNERLNKLF